MIKSMHKRPLKSNEYGAAIIETVLVAPLLVMFFLFVIDFLILSKNKTTLTQAARDAGIYYATYPLPLTLGTVGAGDDSVYLYEGWADGCINLNIANTTGCAEKATFYRTYRSLAADPGQLSLDYVNGDFTMAFSFDGVRASVTITSKLKTLFFFDEKILEQTVVLRRIGS